MFFLVCYDIADDGRLRKVAKVMKGFGERAQRSVFECHLSEKQFERMLKRVRAAMDEQEDGLRVYRLCKSCQEARQAFGIGEVFDPPEVFIV
jgi:CRISPR-associated protein Cas2